MLPLTTEHLAQLAGENVETLIIAYKTRSTYIPTPLTYGVSTYSPASKAPTLTNCLLFPVAVHKAREHLPLPENEELRVMTKLPAVGWYDEFVQMHETAYEPLRSHISEVLVLSGPFNDDKPDSSKLPIVSGAC